MPLVPVPLAGAAAPPSVLFVPPGSHDALPLVLFGHGAHLSKDDPVMQTIAKALCRGVPAAVALLDAPGHGERRAPGIDDAAFDADVRRRMGDPENHRRLANDWRAVEEAARACDARITGPTGYAGFSMGALFGLSIVGELASVRAAVFALGGLQGEPARDALMRAGIARLADREVLMCNMTRDEHFPIALAIEAFEAVPGPKRMTIWSGTHADLPPEAVMLAADFFRRTLAA